MKFKNLVILFIFISPTTLLSQYVYKTPSGEKYHLSSCRMVENVSKRITIKIAIEEYGLGPCKICKPPTREGLIPNKSQTNKAVGKCKSQRCKGITKNGTRCKHMTKLCNGYCFQHNPKDPR